MELKDLDFIDSNDTKNTNFCGDSPSERGSSDIDDSDMAPNDLRNHPQITVPFDESDQDEAEYELSNEGSMAVEDPFVMSVQDPAESTRKRQREDQDTNPRDSSPSQFFNHNDEISIEDIGEPHEKTLTISGEDRSTIESNVETPTSSSEFRVLDQDSSDNDSILSVFDGNLRFTRTNNPLEDVLPYFTSKGKENHDKDPKTWEFYLEKSQEDSSIVFRHLFYTSRDSMMVQWRKFEKHDEPFIIARDITEGCKAKQFGFWESPNGYLEWRKRIPELERNDYEVFWTGQPIRYYVDCDWKKEEYHNLFQMENPIQFLEGFMKKLLEEACRLLGLVSSSDEYFNVFQSHDPTKKFSFHFVSTNIYTNSTAKIHQWILNIKDIMRKDQQYGEIAKGIDEAPYGSSQNFRLLGCCKIGQKNTKKAMKEGVDFIDSLVCVRREQLSKCSFIDYKESKKSNSKKRQRNEIPFAPKKRSSEVQLDAKIRCYLEDVLGLQFDRSDDQLWRFKNLGGYQCPIHNRIHDSQNPYVYIKDGMYYFACGRITEQEKREGMSSICIDDDRMSQVQQGTNDGIMVSNVMEKDSNEIEYPEPTLSNLVAKAKAQENTPVSVHCDHIEYVASSFSTERIDSMIPIFEEENYEVLCESSPKGSGKTYQIVQFVKYLCSRNAKIRILLIGPRRSFVNFMVQKINECLKKETKTAALKMINYQCTEETGGPNYYLDTVPLLSIQIDSLPRIFNKGKRPPSYDLLILDEFKSLLRYMSCKHLKSRMKITEQLTEMINFSKRVIISDADFDQDALNIVDLMLQRGNMLRKVKISINNMRNDKRKYYFYEGKNQLVDSLLKALSRGEKIIFPTNSIKHSQIVEEYIRLKLPNLKILTIHSYNVKGEQREELLDSRNWSKYDLVIHTGCVLAGISFDEEYFHKVFGIFVKMSNPASECCQMLQRVRHLRDQEVHLFVSNMKGIENYRVSENQLNSSLVSRYDEVRDRTGTETFLHEEGVGGFVQEIYTNIWKYNEIERRKSLTNLFQEIQENIKKYVLDPKHQLSIVSAHKTKTSLAEIKKYIAEKHAEAIVKARNVNEEELQTIKNKKEPNQEEYWILKRDFHKKFFKQQTLDVDFVQKWHPRIGSMILFNKFFIDSECELEEKDQKLLSKMYGESLIHLNFASEHRVSIFNLLEEYGMNMEELVSFVFVPGSKKLDLKKINETLAELVLKDQQNPFPTSIVQSNTTSLLFKLTRLLGIPLRKSASRTTEAGTPKKMKYFVDKENFFEWIQILISMHRGHKGHLESIDKLLLSLERMLERTTMKDE